MTEKTINELLMETYSYASKYSMEISSEDQKVKKALFGAACLASGNKNDFVSSVKDENEIQANKLILEKSGMLVRGEIDGYDNENYDKSIYQKILEIAEDTVFGAAKESNLENYGYDMVVSVTLGAINATMKEYVMNMGKAVKPVTKYYVTRYNEKNDTSTVEEANDSERVLFEELKLFDIPADEKQRTNEQMEAIERADEKMFNCAFKAGFGIPDNINPSAIEYFLDFDTGAAGNHTKVKYKMFFNGFKIIQTDYNRAKRKLEFSKIEQGGELWSFKFNVDLGLVDVSSEKVPEEIKKKLINLDPGAMFSIQQLFLDLNTTALQDAPDISGISESAMDTVQRKFVNIYFKKLRELGDVVFAYSVKPSKGSKPYIMKPTDFRFYVSPYLADGKPAPEKKKLYTLNYLVMCDNRPVPADLRAFTWNWVDEKDYSSIHGAMTINKKRILNFAENEFLDIVSKLIFTPYCHIKCNPTDFEFKLSLLPNSDKVSFNNNYYRFNKKDYSDSYWVFPPLWGNITLEYTNESRIKTFQSDRNEAVIECSCDIKIYLKLNAVGGVSSGNIFDKTLYYTLKVSVDAYGILKFVPSVTEGNDNSDFDYNGWSDFISAYTLKDMINKVKSFVTEYVTRTKEFTSGGFLAKYNTGALWAMPGDQTFSFKNPCFSNGSDLSFSINYVKP